ncbi:MAG: hypothetical protein ABSG74_10620 [Candidatus Bathyarchaeia archaeon]
MSSQSDIVVTKGYRITGPSRLVDALIRFAERILDLKVEAA